MKVEDGAVDGEQLGESVEDVALDGQCRSALVEGLLDERLEECRHVVGEPSLEGGA